MRTLRGGALEEFLGKAGLIAVFGVFAASKLVAVASSWASWEHTADLDRHLNLAAQLAGLAFILLLLGTTLLRFRPSRTAEGWEPRISALIGTFLTLSLAVLPPADLGPAWRIAAILLVLLGTLLSIYVLAWLGRSFSLVPQSRRLVTKGPYAIVRHPLYVCEEIATIGIALMCISPLSVLILIVQWLFQLRRMVNEERVLRLSFPEYAAYATRTPRLIPVVFGRRRWSDRFRARQGL
jgi:protein-S-isoprenylcysteine O-methyltransferase Ste14